MFGCKCCKEAEGQSVAILPDTDENYGAAQEAPQGVIESVAVLISPRAQQAAEAAKKAVETVVSFVSPRGKRDEVKERDDEPAAEPTTDAEAAVVTAPTFMVLIDRDMEGGPKLGCDVKYVEDNKYLFIFSYKKGLVDEYNKANPDNVIHAGYYIVGVNGVTGNAEEMYATMIKNKKLELEICRGHPQGKSDIEVPELAPLPPVVVPSLTLEFEDFFTGEVKSFEFFKRPLGFTFAEKMPNLAAKVGLKALDGVGLNEVTLIVSKVPAGSYAFELGVKEGWRIMKVAGEDIPVGTEYDDLSAKLKKAVNDAGLPDYKRVSLTEAGPIKPLYKSPINVPSAHPWDPQLSVEFTDEEGEVQKVKFVRQPLGLTFAEKPTKTGTIIIVSKVRPGTHAFELFVKEGWQFSNVAGEDIPEGTTYEELSAKLKSAVEAAALPEYTRRSLTAKDPAP
jgi:hypothetical protein